MILNDSQIRHSELAAAGEESLLRLVFRISRRAWWYLRQISGDAAYENYLSRLAKTHRTQDSGPLSSSIFQPFNSATHLDPGSFYLDQLRRRYSRPSRCC